MSGRWQEVSDGLSPLLGEHLRAIIPPLSSLAMTAEWRLFLSVGVFSLGQNPLSKAKNGCVRAAASASMSYKVALFKKKVQVGEAAKSVCQ